MNTLSRLTLALAAGAALACAQPVTVTVTNPLPERRDLETVEIPWSALVPLHTLQPAVFEHDRPLVSQVLDVNGDGSPDLVIVQSSFGPHEKKSFTVRDGGPSPSDGPTDARFELPRQDLAWENERIAFRMYGSVLAGDVKNGIDVWCKRVRTPIVAKWYAASVKAGKDTYHEDHGEGADFFSVGRSLGAGSCAVVSGDTLLQPGLFTGHRILATGPIRALFELQYDSAGTGGQRFRVTTRISLDAGSSLNRIEAVFTGLPARDSIVLAAGLVRRANVTPGVDREKRWVALWGPTNADTVNGFLGTGIVMAAPGPVAVRESATHLLMAVPGLQGRPFVYYAGAAWTRAGDLKTREEWEGLLASAARRVAAPLVVEIAARTK